MAVSGSKWDYQLKAGSSVTAAGWTLSFDVLKDGVVQEAVIMNLPPGLPWGAVERQMRRRVMKSRNDAIATELALDTTTQTVVDDTGVTW